MWLSPFFTSPYWEDAAASAITLAICVLWLASVNALVKAGILEQRLSRKVVHIFTGPIFLLCWNLFSSLTSAPLSAALVPFLITSQFLLTGLGLLSDPETVASICRTGNPRELLYGPLFYGITFVIVTTAFWRHSPVGILALMVLCGGDGLAEVVGRRFGSAPEQKLPWAPTKSWPGTLAMFLGSFLFGFSFVSFFHFCGNFDPPLYLMTTAVVILIISVAAALVESLCWEHWDNVVVPVLVLGLGQLAFPLMYKEGQPLWSAA